MNRKLLKLLIISALCVVVNSCKSSKLTANNTNQEDYNDKRQEAFDELYNNYH